MKKLMLFSLLLAMFTSISFAANSDVLCDRSNYPSQDVDKEFKCMDGTWKEIIALDVKLNEGNKLLGSFFIYIIDGMDTPVSMGVAHSNAVVKLEEQFFIVMTPTFKQDGLINLEVAAKKSELQTIRILKVDDLELPLPEVNHFEFKSMVRLQRGKEFAIPFGPIVNLGNSIDAKYTLKITAKS